MRWPRRGAPEQPRGPVADLRLALQLVLGSDLAGAERALTDAARRDSGAADVHLALANLLRARGDIARAIQIHQNLLLRPHLPEDIRREALLGLALDFRVGGFLQRSAAAFEDLLQLDPDNSRALEELERIHIDGGEWEQAIRIRKRIGRSDPRTPRVLGHLRVGLGRARLQEGREGEARSEFRRALREDRRCAEAYLALGDLHLRQGRPRRAVRLWRRTLDLHPAIGLLTYPRLWEVHVALGEIRRLEALLVDRVDARPDDREASLWLGRARVRAGRLEEGIAVLRRAITRDPSFLAAHAEIGRVLLREHREPEALKAFEELLERLPVERTLLRCRTCGTQDSELHWRCPQCGEWDSFV